MRGVATVYVYRTALRRARAHAQVLCDDLYLFARQTNDDMRMHNYELLEAAVNSYCLSQSKTCSLIFAAVSVSLVPNIENVEVAWGRGYVSIITLGRAQAV